MTKQITVLIPLEQLKEIHEVWIQFASVLEIAKNDDGSATILTLLKPLESRMSAVVFEEWEGMMDKAEVMEGAQEVKGGQEILSEVQIAVGNLDELGYAIEEIQAVYAELRKNTGLEQLPVSQQVEKGGVK